jgi:hypothetical protein
VRIMAGCTASGAALGAVVAVLTHFLSHTLPSSYTVGYWQYGDTTHVGDVVHLGSPPQVHPSWQPSLLIALLVGAVVGLAVGGLLHGAGIRIGRPLPPR